ncbi:MAG TPA: hypothetical protein VFJ17_15300 [Mycobacteriales bacterium]|jgi:hypothetical protein|nr:hypothetical protein [Mycobacteriales bacterium]
MDDADALMEHLPPSGWADIARRSDLDHLHRLLEADVEALESRLRAEMHGVRSEMQGVRGDLLEKMADQTRTLMVGMTATVIAALGTVTALSVVVH